jgi:hypothetical protein
MRDARSVIVERTAPAGLENEQGVERMLSELRARCGEHLQAVLLYGSYLRGVRDTLLDFYVVVDGYRGALGSPVSALGARVLPPNVYYLAVGEGAERVRAKYAVVTMRQLRRQAASGLHPYFWARFAQPARIVYARWPADEAALVQIIEQCVRTFVKRVAPTLRGDFTSREFWARGFALTYRSELRSESAGRSDSIIDHDPDYYDNMLAAVADGRHLVCAGGRYRAVRPRVSAAVEWACVIALGKFLSVGRLVKGALTFDDALDYILWKVERHSGVRVEASARQHRYPLIFAWPLVWRLYRRGAFR